MQQITLLYPFTHLYNYIYKGFNTSVLRYILVIVSPVIYNEYLLIVMHIGLGLLLILKKKSSQVLINGALKI